MKLLMTNDEMHEVRGGTQVFIMDLATALKARGHEVAVYSWLRGSVAAQLRDLGVPVVGNPRECGFVPDVIHGQHHLAAMSALCAFPGVPGIYHCHGYGPWQEQPPVHPRIASYVAMAKAMANWMAAVTGRKAQDIVVVPNCVHLGRFQRVRHLDRKPRHALLFGNRFMSGESISKLRRACARCGLTLDMVGAQFGNATSAPEQMLADYDIVFSVGRSALEALASGCAVVPVDGVRSSAMVRPETLQYYMERNFTVPENLPDLSRQLLIKQIRQFDARRAAAVTMMIRQEAHFERTCDQLESLYVTTAQSWNGSPRSSPEEESSALSAYLNWLGPHVKGADDRFIKLRMERAKSKERVARLKLKLAASEHRWEKALGRLPLVIRRWLVGRVE